MMRRLWVLVAVCAAVVGVVGTVLAVLPDDPAPPPGGAPRGAAPAGGHRLVGLGHVAVAVPAGWGTNRLRCGVPQQDTVVIDVGAVPLCGTARPAGVESVEVRQDPPPPGLEAGEPVRVDGVAGRRQPTTCAPGDLGGARVCTGTVYLPSAKVCVRADSSTGAGAVDRILQRIRVVPRRVGVPGFQTVALRWQGRADEQYAQILRRMGLRPEVRTRREPGAPAGFVLDVSPQPGTMVRPGTVVTVGVAAG